MLIDWFTVIAQALNFLILVWLMKHFLYRPILNSIDKREQWITTELANAEAKKAEAQKEKEEFKRKNEEFDQQRHKFLSEAREEAETERQKLLEEARKAASDLSSRLQETLRNDMSNLNQAIIRSIQQEVFATARKVLADLSDTDLEERMFSVFLRRLHELNDEERGWLASALETSSRVTIRTAFDLPQAQRALIKNAVNEAFKMEVQARFETVPDLISGIELTANGKKVSWSVMDYLASLDASLEELLTEQARPETKAEPEPGHTPGKPAPSQEPGPEPEPEPEQRADQHGT